MISRQSREPAAGVLSFTFLDVLTCTMGSLVLLVVVLGQKASNTRLEDALRNGPRRAAEGATTSAATAPASTDSAESPEINAEPEQPLNPLNPAEAAAALAEIREQEAKLESLRAEAAERVGQEQTRVSQLEDHERRLEHELAQLHITLERLEATEKKQTVDQQSAERDLERLRQLLKDTEEQLKGLRTMAGGKKSFAIVPYKGKNGTFRRPIYIECTAHAVVIRPEGIVLTPIDFDGPIRSGNPLAAAVRAAREELNARASAAGSDELPDPYPLLIVRPQGERAYRAAVDAIGTWDGDYGYEFVEADWDLAFPEPDPQLSQVMTHAVEQARSRQATLARIAPRRYGTRLPTEGHAPRNDNGVHTGSGPASNEAGFDALTSVGGSGSMIGQRAGKGWLSSSLDGAGGESSSGPKQRAHDGIAAAQAGEVAGDGTGSGSGTFAQQVVAESTPDERYASKPATSATVDAAKRPDRQPADASSVASAMAQGQGQAGMAGGSMTESAGGATDSIAAAPESAESATSTGGPLATGSQLGAGQTIRANDRSETASAAEKRGANWANDAAKRRATPITRPVHVVVRPDQLDVLESGDGPATEAAVISFHQPTDKVLDELAVRLRQRVKDWGLAGQGMYWRPTLVLEVSPEADQHAARLNDLLRDSGVDVRLQEVAARPQQEQSSGPR